MNSGCWLLLPHYLMFLVLTVVIVVGAVAGGCVLLLQSLLPWHHLVVLVVCKLFCKWITGFLLLYQQSSGSCTGLLMLTLSSVTIINLYGMNNISGWAHSVIVKWVSGRFHHSQLLLMLKWLLLWYMLGMVLRWSRILPFKRVVRGLLWGRRV